MSLTARVSWKLMPAKLEEKLYFFKNKYIDLQKVNALFLL